MDRSVTIAYLHYSVKSYACISPFTLLYFVHLYIYNIILRRLYRMIRRELKKYCSTPVKMYGNSKFSPQPIPPDLPVSPSNHTLDRPDLVKKIVQLPIRLDERMNRHYFCIFTLDRTRITLFRQTKKHHFSVLSCFAVRLFGQFVA
jgi:hypothetical protein